MPSGDYRSHALRLVKGKVSADGKNLANYKGANLIREPITLAFWIIRGQARRQDEGCPKSDGECTCRMGTGDVSEG